MFSAKGAALIAAWGSAPGSRYMPKVPALKARFIPESFRSVIGLLPQSLSKVIIHIIWLC
jgi:hypothetical protein